MKELSSYLISSGIVIDNLSKDEYHTLELLFFNYRKYSKLSSSSSLDSQIGTSLYGNLVINAQNYKSLLDNYITSVKKKSGSRVRIDLQN